MMLFEYDKEVCSSHVLLSNDDLMHFVMVKPSYVSEQLGNWICRVTAFVQVDDAVVRFKCL
jgi:hypothetical protein